MLRVWTDQLSPFFPEIIASSVTLSPFQFLSSCRDEAENVLEEIDTTKRVLQTKGFQVTETSRSSCHLNELRTALKMKRRDEDSGRGKRSIGGRTRGKTT